MKEKSEKELIIKTLTQENLRIASLCAEQENVKGMVNILQQENDYLK